MTEGATTLVSGLAYNAAGQITSMNFEGWTETRQYNGLNQMTRLTVSGGIADWEYRYPWGSNNGRIK